MVLDAYALYTATVGLVVFSLATVVYFTAPNRAQNRWLAVMLAVTGFAHAGMAGRLVTALGPETNAGMFAVFRVAVSMMPATYILFLGTLDTPVTRWCGRRSVRVSVVALTILFVAAQLAVPRLAPPVDGERLGQGVAYGANTVTNVLGLIAAFLLWRATEKGTLEHRRGFAYLLAFGTRDGLFLLFFVGFFTARLIGAQGLSDVFGWLPPTADLLFALLMSYGIMRTRLFDIDVKIKWTLKQSTVAAIFIAVFFAASEGAAAVITNQTGSTAFGIGAAAALVFVLAPIQRMAERVADTAMPNVRPVGELDRDERADIYAGLVQTAWQDGRLDPNERVMLADLRRRLGLTSDDVEVIELGVARRLGDEA